MAVSTTANHFIMKKIYVLLLVTAVTILGATAQPFQKGDKLLGGSIGYSIQRSTYNATPSIPGQNYDSKYYNFNVAPSFGFFTKPNRLTGFSLLFGYGSSFRTNTDNQKTYSYGAGFFKQYWNALGKNFYFNIQGRTGLIYNRTLFSNPIQKVEERSASAYIAIEPGFAYRMKRRLVLDAYYTGFLTAGYNYDERRYNGSTFTRNYSVSANSGLQNFSLNSVILGFRYLL